MKTRRYITFGSPTDHLPRRAWWLWWWSLVTKHSPVMPGVWVRETGFRLLGVEFVSVKPLGPNDSVL